MREYIVPISDEENINMIEHELQLQELVRCKECKWREDGRCYFNKIIPYGMWTDNDWFCADGQRKK